MNNTITILFIIITTLLLIIILLLVLSIYKNSNKDIEKFRTLGRINDEFKKLTRLNEEILYKIRNAMEDDRYYMSERIYKNKASIDKYNDFKYYKVDYDKYLFKQITDILDYYFSDRLPGNYDKKLKDILDKLDSRLELQQVPIHTSSLDEGIRMDEIALQFLEQITNLTNIDSLIDLTKKYFTNEYEIVKGVIGDIAHTIRNPKAGAQSIIEVMRLTLKENAEALQKLNDLSKYLDQIESDINTYLEIINKLSINYNGDKVEFTSYLQDTISMLIISSVKKVQPRYNFEPFTIDSQVAQMLMICIRAIVENAIYYSKDNGIIEISSIRSNGMTEINILNYGSSIDLSLKERVFEEGFSTRKSSGRGLALAKKIVEIKLDGVLDFENLPDNVGVKFSILLSDDKLLNSTLI